MVLLVPQGLTAGNEKEPEPLMPGVFQMDPFLVQVLPGGHFYPFVIENYVPDATFLIEENNGFSLLDNPRVYFEGDSYTQFNWQFNGFNMNSSLNEGAPAVMLPFSTIGAYRMQGESPLYNDYGMNILTGIQSGNGSRVMVSGVVPDAGGLGAKFMLQPSHPTERADMLYNERRKITSNYFVDYQWTRHTQKSHFQVALNYFDMKRQFNDFNVFDNTFEEAGKLLLVNARLRKDLSEGHLDLFGVFNHMDRTNDGAELSIYPQETVGKDRYAVMGGIHLKKKSLDLKVSGFYEKETLTPFMEDYSKDLMDTDGDGIDSIGRLGEFSALTLNGNLRVPLKVGKKLGVEFYVDGRFSRLSGKEDMHNFSSLTFDREPYQVIEWGSTISSVYSDYSYANTNADANAGFRVCADLSPDISLLGNVMVKYNYLGFQEGDNNLNFFSPGFDVGVLLFKNKKTNILFSYGRIPYDIRENVNFFLENQRPGGTIRFWEDHNGDSVYQDGEKGAIYGYTGGPYHRVDDDIKAPYKERFLVHFSTRLSKRWTLNIKGLYKTIRNNFRVKFQEEYGFYETHNGHNIHFFSQPFDEYYLTNNYLEKDPFYAQFHFDIQGRKENKWFFSFAFMAHMGMGDTAFGNGPGTNDIGILAENQADPNTWINGYGRVDGDRGFVAKSYFGFYLFKNLFISTSLKYRDGDPFAFINTLSRYGQQVLYYKTIKAEDKKGKKGGPREDYIADLSVKLNYRFKLLNRDAVLSLTFFNLLDIGGELSEYVFSGGTRDAVEMQIPRSLRLTLTWAL